DRSAPSARLGDPAPRAAPASFSSRLRRPPRPTLFPYTRSSDLFLTFHHRDLSIFMCIWSEQIKCDFLAQLQQSESKTVPCGDLRSEEHTSELQSRENLVCRLLLEKKNTVDKQSVLYSCSSAGRQ